MSCGTLSSQPFPSSTGKRRVTENRFAGTLNFFRSSFLFISGCWRGFVLRSIILFHQRSRCLSNTGTNPEAFGRRIFFPAPAMKATAPVHARSYLETHSCCPGRTLFPLLYSIRRRRSAASKGIGFGPRRLPAIHFRTRGTDFPQLSFCQHGRTRRMNGTFLRLPRIWLFLSLCIGRFGWMCW